jgi:hypothetical protein
MELSNTIQDALLYLLWFGPLGLIVALLLGSRRKRTSVAREDYPPAEVPYRVLNPDGCNIQDREFEDQIGRFMDRYMTSFPISLLDTGDFERWDLDPIGTCEVETDHDENDDLRFYVIDQYGDRHNFDGEREADDFARDDNDEAEQGRYGYPWAQNTCFYPSDNIHDEDLKAAGFTIARYRDGHGDWMRLCGIDGGGYCLTGAHFSKLCAIVHHRWGRPVQTVNGPRLIMFPAEVTS